MARCLRRVLSDLQHGSANRYALFSSGNEGRPTSTERGAQRGDVGHDRFHGGGKPFDRSSLVGVCVTLLARVI